MKNVILILPTYNEKDNVETLIGAIEGVFQKLTKYKLTILVVDDYSPDGTAKTVENLSKRYNNIILISKKKEGLGAAYMFGANYAFKYLQPDIFIQMDADWQHNPLLLPDFFYQLERGADLVIGSRYIPGGSIPGNWGIHRKIYSIVGNTVVRFGLGMLLPHDWTSGYRVYKKQVFTEVEAGLEKYSGYTFQVAFLRKAKVAGFKIAEVPQQFADRIHGKSKIAPFDYIKNLLLYILNNSTFLKYLVIGVIGFSVQTIIAKVLVQFINPGIAVAIGSFFAICANFLGNNLWTFSHKRISGLTKLSQKFIHFLGTSIGAVIIQGVVVGVGVWLWGKSAWFLLMIFAIAFLVIPYNYFIYNRFIWKK
ncbi:MAG: hypothetical protein ACD_12C00160G0002 [uncultured bacterium]|uniref:Dolichyl-phosphate beta-D-mannosyltransferase n=1 Tax=Candidatus Gottesmanbacteria bacterium GW2011_GWB1_43_11 TaxID=1618446 RepID=A0A0G1CNP5_9BACT|nr:MAG: hypothetical protein ACD_12C00160G0002 [uncultured bacterium]KKS42133.1 MAG: Dolichyl-phosphate beta-D-mannosyltransferase [Candidatus Gottesmanbacteria bacterium GW2011_GWA2_42_16]KKS56192.1 MAG: Dolichyl-phosphate beta-D-mannosyltransferase [Candidatus Gottesmanbacteria bacterium GW2011_GWA1_42_26]KKS81800.1 MAG: glycosyltransferase [Candidatus Gottesmanbacteria bacterium GW2011_GWC1_43_10]KKS87395.1 MAG: Dolichyl-phosphate beta-D-mannosyltransferase [Candidatus Gottesmanbacteria bact